MNVFIFEVFSVEPGHLWTFNPLQAQRWHVGNDPFGRQWLPGDVVGCMIDLVEMNIMFTLNGEMLISDSGSDMAFKDIEIGDGKTTTSFCSCSVQECLKIVSSFI